MKTKTWSFTNFIPLTPVGDIFYSEPLDFSANPFPKKIEATLEVSKFEGGMMDGSRLEVILQRSIDGIAWFGEEFLAIERDLNDEPQNMSQNMVVFDSNDFIGNQLRVVCRITQGDLSPTGIPSIADFKVTALVK